MNGRRAARGSTNNPLRLKPAIVLGVCAILLALIVVWRQLGGGGQVIALKPAPEPSPSITTAPPASTSAAPTENARYLVIHVTGQVGSPGIVQLRVGQRVNDAVAAAGGFTPEADKWALNLAAPLRDGDQIYVPKQGETARVPPASGPPGESKTQIDINRAPASELQKLPGIGPVLAAAIVHHREKNGAFSTFEDLLKVSGIGKATLARIRPHATLG